MGRLPPRIGRRRLDHFHLIAQILSMIAVAKGD